ncbi:hypothetical protein METBISCDRAFT_15104 [Metschnikowia bicuspidata]|uniref:Aminopeptidase P N-terminal domain-containing protein n=1 Tax=Metschnikowia bicuspidata TaxID=27322 RepID=A0A4P9ZG33_9ASCO|nr:hypothetical protein METBISCDRAFT_15104 [Metschnikowia bicuspidata]
MYPRIVLLRCRRPLSRNIYLDTRPPLEVPYKTGQPLHETRTHMIPRPGHLTPGINAAEYYLRRWALTKEMPKKSAAILLGNRVQFSSGAIFYEFQQDNDFYYLTGWLGPDSVAVVEKVSDTGTDVDVVFHMIVPPKNVAKDLWEGDKTGTEGAFDYFNADEVHELGRVDTVLKEIIARNDVIFFDDKSRACNESSASGKFSQFFGLGNARLHHGSIIQMLSAARKPTRLLQSILAQHRLVKSPAEIAVMHAAGRISSRAINTAIARVGLDQPFQTEKVLAQYLEYAFIRGGCDRQAYIPVVASGENALTIHYTRNDDLLYRDETVFVDAGGKLGGYCADISRAWPNSPRGFSDAQRDIYSVVLGVNKTCIEQCHESSSSSLQAIHELAVTSLTNGLRQLPGFLALTGSEVSRELFPHFIGHHLGLDLHDVPSISRLKPLKKGNVVTIEPGLYIPVADKWLKHFRGIGVRVEDDIAVGTTSSDITNLTSLCVKEVADIEALISRGKVTTPGVYDEAVVVDI